MHKEKHADSFHATFTWPGSLHEGRKDPKMQFELNMYAWNWTESSQVLRKQVTWGGSGQVSITLAPHCYSPSLALSFSAGCPVAQAGFQLAV